jgi:hypothetical protein
VPVIASSPTLLDNSNRATRLTPFISAQDQSFDGRPRRPLGIFSAKFVDLAAVSFGGAAGATVSLKWADIYLFYRWTVIIQTLGRTWCPNPLVDQLDHFNDALTLRDASFNSIANLHGTGRLRRCAVHHHSPSAAKVSCRRTSRSQPHRPQPHIDSHGLHPPSVTRFRYSEPPGFLRSPEDGSTLRQSRSGSSSGHGCRSTTTK